MAEPSTHINYSFDDVQRYLQGKMSAAEMHAIEKAALQDPFLADAIDGYREADANTAKQHLNEINATLFAEKTNTKIVGFNKRMQWLNVAALVIVLAGIGVVAAYFLRSSSSNPQTEIAKLRQEPVKNESLNDSASAMTNSYDLSKKTDTALFIAENKSAKKTLPSSSKIKSDEKLIIAENKAAKQTEAYTYKADDTDKYAADVAIAAAPSAPVEKETMMSRSLAVTDTPSHLQGKVSGFSVLPFPATFSGKVVNTDNDPIPFVMIESPDKKIMVLTDANGNFNLKKIDSILNVTASTVGYETRNIALKQGTNNIIVLKETNLSLNEVVVTTARVQKKSRSDSAMPVGGWNNFNLYVISQLNKDTTTYDITNPDDLVELEFLVDKAGNPYNIEITKSLDDLHNSKAVEILKNGPKWTSPSRKKKAKVAINF